MKTERTKLKEREEDSIEGEGENRIKGEIEYELSDTKGRAKGAGVGG